MRLGVVYKVIIEGNFIIGSTLEPENRERAYRCLLNLNKWDNVYVQRMYNKSGKLQFEIMQSGIPEDILLFVEDIWIGALCGKAEDKMGGMNFKDASRPKHSLETKLRLSKIHKERYSKLSKEEKDTIKGSKKSVSQYDIEWNLIKIWDSLSQIKRDSKFNSRKISIACKEKSILYGCYWKFNNDYNAGKISSKVYKYSLEGYFIEEFDSVNIAAEYMNVSPTTIYNSIKYENTMGSGFLWSNKNLPFLQPYVNRKGEYKKRKVAQNTLNGEFIKMWDSASQAISSGFNSSLICECCNGNRKSHGGFKWEYA